MKNYPLPYWWDFTVSGPTLPDFYWNVKSQEERIKKICEDLWKLIQLYKMLVDAINDHEKRISTLEAQMQWVLQQITNLVNLYNNMVDEINQIKQDIDNIEQEIQNINTKIENLEDQITNLINNLPDMIKNLIQNDTDIHETIENIVNELVSGKMDLVAGAVSGNVATYGNGGQVVDSGTKLSDLATKVDLESKMDKVPTATEDNITTWGANGQVQDSGMSMSEFENQIIQEIQNQSLTGTPGQIPIFNTDGNGLSNSGLLFSQMYIEATEETAKDVSTANPLSLVYIPEEEE